jgi:carboxyl-terminal processing protease
MSAHLFRLALAMFVSLAPSPYNHADSSTATVFDEVWSAVNERFLDPTFNGVDWLAMREHYGPLVNEAEDDTERAALINDMLRTLRTSHTRYLTPAEPAYYQLLGIFLPRNAALAESLEEKRPGTTTRYVGVGMFTHSDPDGRVFVRDVIHGMPAAKAGLRIGEEVLLVNGVPFQPIASFEGKAGDSVLLSIRRERGAEPITVSVVPVTLDGATMFENALRSSFEVVEQDGFAIGYARPWSYAGAQYQTLLENALIWGELREADALVLDIRGGWGGASPSYLNLFTERQVVWESVGRDGTRTVHPSAWGKPVVLLTDERSRSGKELLAYGFRKFALGPIVGERTAGAVVAGAPLLMSDGSLLYLAVADARIDGERLEGVGVAPDIRVPFDSRFANGADPQRDAAFAEAVSTLSQAGTSASKARP